MSKLIDSNKAWELIDKTIAKIQNNNYVAEQKWFDDLWKDFVDLPDKNIDIEVQDNYKQSYTLFSKEDEKLLYQLTDIINNDNIFLYQVVKQYKYGPVEAEFYSNYLKNEKLTIMHIKSIIQDIASNINRREFCLYLEYKDNECKYKKYPVVEINSQGIKLLKENITELTDNIKYDNICVKENMIASYDYEHNDGDQIWSNTTEFYKDKDTNTFVRKYQDGYTGKVSYCNVLLDGIIKDINRIKEEIKIKESFEVGSVYRRGGYKLYKDIPKECHNNYERDEENIDTDKDAEGFDYE